MKALVFEGKEAISYTTVADPSIISPTDAIVRVQLCAVCGSDLHVYHQSETGLDNGTVMGHEFAGDIVAIGSNVRLLKIGDQVVSPFTTNCGTCYYCKIGLTCRCTQGQLYGWVEKGKGLHGAQAQYVRVPLADTTLVKYDPSIPIEIALLTGDIRATGYHCATQANIQPNGVYVVVGCGPVGLMCIIAAFELGAEQVYAIDTLTERLNLAKHYGAMPINATQTDAVAILKDATNGHGADGVLEAVGSPQAMQLAYNLLRPGGTLSSVGVHTTKQFSFSPIDAYDKNITLRMGRAPARHYMQQLLNNSTQTLFDPSLIITHRFALAQGAAAYQLFDTKQQGCIKAVLSPFEN